MDKKEDNDTLKKKIILFGAGKRGKEALDRYGKDQVAFFCDNSVDKKGTLIDGIRVLSFDQLVSLYDGQYIIMITMAASIFVIGQLEKAGITDYIFYLDYKPWILDYPGREDATEKEHNDMLRGYVKESSREDLLNSIVSFKDISKRAICEAKKKNLVLNYCTRGEEEEGYRYGNLQTLLKYADRKHVEGTYIPVVSHVMSVPIYAPIYKHKTAVLFSGDYYKDLIHKRAPWVPVFTVGPYIQYANGIYNTTKLNLEKERIGSMLLAFLPHTLEDTERSFDRKKYIDAVKEKYGKNYSQIWLCVYFADINDPVCEYAEKIGIHVVSAGFRFDPIFNDRLKTIIQLSDAVVCGDIGGFITYSLYFNKPIARIDINDKMSSLDMQYQDNVEKDIQKTVDYVKFENDFYSLFDEELTINDEKINWMEPLAGYGLKRSKTYISDIFEICDDIWKESGGNYRKYPDAVRKTFFKYNDRDDVNRMSILREAVGTFLD